MGQRHYRKIVQFYLLKVDEWADGDQLQLYLNDLLVMSKTYSKLGNNICFDPTQNDFISYESIEIEDSNSSLSISFEVVAGGGGSRKFGVAGF